LIFLVWRGGPCGAAAPSQVSAGRRRMREAGRFRHWGVGEHSCRLSLCGPRQVKGVPAGLLRRHLRRVPFLLREKRYEKARFNVKVQRFVVSGVTGCGGWPLRCAGFAKIPSEDQVALAEMGRSRHEGGSASKAGCELSAHVQSPGFASYCIAACRPLQQTATGAGSMKPCAPSARCNGLERRH